MRSKTTVETRFLGMYIFATAIAIGLAAFAYTSVFDIEGALPVTKICNAIVVCASGIGIMYSYIAAEANSERRLARIYARRDAVIVMAMTVYFVTGSSVFGMATDAMSHGDSIVPMMFLPATMAGGTIMVASVIAMVSLAILEHMANRERVRIEQRLHEGHNRPDIAYVGHGNVVTERELRRANMPSKAYYADADPDGVLNYIPLSQMGVTRVTGNRLEPVHVSSMSERKAEEDAEKKRQRETRQQARRAKMNHALDKTRRGAEAFFARVGATTISAGTRMANLARRMWSSIAKASVVTCHWACVRVTAMLSAMLSGLAWVASRIGPSMRKLTHVAAKETRKLGESAWSRILATWHHMADSRMPEEPRAETASEDVTDMALSLDDASASGSQGDSPATTETDVTATKTTDGISESDIDATCVPDDIGDVICDSEDADHDPEGEVGSVAREPADDHPSDADCMTEETEKGQTDGSDSDHALTLPATGATIPSEPVTDGYGDMSVPPFLRPFVKTARNGSE